MNPICPYCRTEVGEAEGERKDCPGCATPHHSDCFAENGGCTVFGCSDAPADEAKVTVSATDMMGNVVTRQVTPAAPSVSLGAGFTTFRAPVGAVLSAALPPQVAVVPSLPPPPPPALPGSGVAPPPPPSASAQRRPYVPAQLPAYSSAPLRKTRVVFVLLGIFLGVFGVHNFYAGYAKKGAMQLFATVVIGAYAAIAAWLWFVVWGWAIVEICTVKTDGDGTEFV